MYRRLSYIQKCINIDIFRRNIGKKSLLTIWYFTVSKTTGRYQTSQLPTCFGYIDSTELLFEKKGSGKSHNLQLLTIYEVFYVYLCLLLTSFGNSPIKFPTQRFVFFFLNLNRKSNSPTTGGDTISPIFQKPWKLNVNTRDKLQFKKKTAILSVLCTCLLYMVIPHLPWQSQNGYSLIKQFFPFHPIIHHKKEHRFQQVPFTTKM